MGRPKGGKNRFYTTEFKLRIMEELEQGDSTRSLGEKYNINYRLIAAWATKYRNGGEEALTNKRKPGNSFGGAYNKKFKTEEERLRYELAIKEVEIMKLKKLIELQKGKS